MYNRERLYSYPGARNVVDGAVFAVRGARGAVPRRLLFEGARLNRL